MFNSFLKQGNIVYLLTPGAEIYRTHDRLSVESSDANTFTFNLMDGEVERILNYRTVERWVVIPRDEVSRYMVTADDHIYIVERPSGLVWMFNKTTKLPPNQKLIDIELPGHALINFNVLDKPSDFNHLAGLECVGQDLARFNLFAYDFPLTDQQLMIIDQKAYYRQHSKIWWIKWNNQ